MFSLLFSTKKILSCETFFFQKFIKNLEKKLSRYDHESVIVGQAIINERENKENKIDMVSCHFFCQNITQRKK